MSTDVEVQIAVDYVCALAETLLCLQCKNLPQKAHHCINCHSVFCYLCIHKSEICPHCHVKYSDKSYLTYYELGDSNVEFIFTMVNRLQKENTRMPLFIKKIAAQNNSVKRKSMFEIGNSSKQTEFSDNTDKYLMQIENNPNVINQVGADAKSELFNDSDLENTSNEETTHDPPWNASPKKSEGKRKDKKHKIETNAAKVKVTKKSMNLVEHKRNGNLRNSEQNVENNISKCEMEVPKESINKRQMSDNGTDDSSLGQLVEELEKLDKKKHPEHIGDKSINIDNPENKISSSHAKVNSDVKTNGFKPKSKMSLEEELFGNKIENPKKVIPFVTRTYENRSKSLSFHEKSDASVFDFDGTIDIGCPKGTRFSDYKQYSMLKKDDQCKQPKKEPELKLEKEKGTEREKDTQDEIFEALFQDSKGQAKRKVLLKENPSSKKKNKSADNETNEPFIPFNDVGNVEKSDLANMEQSSKRTRKQLGYNKNTSEIEKLIQSKKLKIENNVNSEIENEGTVDVHMKDLEELNQKEIDRIICKDKEITMVSQNTRKRKNSNNNNALTEVKNLDVIGKTIQRTLRNKVTSESSTDMEPSSVDDIDKTLQTRPARRKVNSESSTDVELCKEKRVNHGTNETGLTKRIKSTRRGADKKNTIDECTLENEDGNQATSTNRKSAKATCKTSKTNESTSVCKKAEEESAFEENPDKFTPKIIPKKRVLKRTALQEKHTELKNAAIQGKETQTSNSVSSESTGDYYTPLEETPLGIIQDKAFANKISGPATPRTSRFNRVPAPNTGQAKGNVTNSTPSEKNPTTHSTTRMEIPTIIVSSVMKNPSTPASNVMKNPSTTASSVKKNLSIPASSLNKKRITPASSVNKNPITPASSVNKNPLTPESSVNKNPLTPASSVKKNPMLNAYMYKRNMKGETPLHTACKKDATKVLTLLQNNMTPNVKDNAGWTPLHDAISLGNEAVARLLLEAGALVNIPGLDNDTPLHLAARHERPALGRLLVQYGADTELRNLHGYKPLEYFDVIGRPDLKAQILTARSLPPLVASTPAPPPPSCIDLVLFGESLDRGAMGLLGQLAKTLTSPERPIIVSTLLQSNVSTIIVRGTTDRLCAPSSNILHAILCGVKAVDLGWVEECLATGRVVDTAGYEILGTVNYPQARPFVKSRQNKEKLLPDLFNGLQAYVSKPWSPSACLTQDELRHLLKLGGACLLNREPDPESTNQNEATVLYHVTDPAHRLYRLSQAILYPEQAAPRRVYNMEHVKALGLTWFVACIEQFQIVEPPSLY